MWSLDGGVAINYKGGWSAGTYNPGDIVVLNGIEYMCVRQTVKQPTPWAMNQVATYGISLPASPIDGQEAVLVDSITAPTFQWRFRYNANSTSPYKWEFIGGNSWLRNDEADVSTTSTSYITVGTLPTFPGQRSGVYQVSYGANSYNSVANTYNYTCLFTGNVAGTVFYHNQNATAGVWLAAAFRKAQVVLDVAVNNAIDLRHMTNGGTAHWGQRTLEVLPVRVS